MAIKVKYDLHTCDCSKRRDKTCEYADSDGRCTLPSSEGWDCKCPHEIAAERLVDIKRGVLSSLITAKMMDAGQSLRVLINVAGKYAHCATKQEVQKVLQKLKRKGRVQYYSETKVWFLLDDVEELKHE